MEEYFRVGVLTSEHGIKGEIKVFPTTDDPKKFKKLKRAFIDLSSGKGSLKKEGLFETEIEGVKFFKNLVIVKFKNIDKIEEIAKYKGLDLLIAREDAGPLKQGEYYIPDVIGCSVITEEGEEYGVVSDVLDTGANKVLVVKAEGKYEELKEFCLPYIPQCVREINVEKRYVKFFLMPGLID